MVVTKEEKQQIIRRWQVHPGDVGSTALQVAVLTKEIEKLTNHFRTHRHDNNSKRGLYLKLARRKKLLKYLERQNKELYAKVITEFGI